MCQSCKRPNTWDVVSMGAEQLHQRFLRKSAIVSTVVDAENCVGAQDLHPQFQSKEEC